MSDSTERLVAVLQRCADKLAEYGEIGHVSLARDAIEKAGRRQGQSIGRRKAAQIGKVVGVMVENDAGAFAAVHDLGRVTWLDDCVAQPCPTEAHPIPGSREVARGDVALMGDVTDVDGTTFHKALVVQFATQEDFHAAVQAGRCRFTVFGGEA